MTGLKNHLSLFSLFHVCLNFQEKNSKCQKAVKNVPFDASHDVWVWQRHQIFQSVNILGQSLYALVSLGTMLVPEYNRKEQLNP